MSRTTIVLYREKFSPESDPAIPAGPRLIDLRTLGEAWPDAVNARISQSQSDYILFLADNVSPIDDCLEKLQNALAGDDRLAGANPLLVNRSQASITHMGYVFDSQLRLCRLYEGISPDDPLAARKRRFQIAASACLLVRRSDFLRAGGIRSEAGELCLVELCRRLCQLVNGCFTTEPEARAIHENHLGALADKGLWDSLALRRKLPPGIVTPDYYRHAADDSLQYGITGWLCETALVEAGAADAWLVWRRDPSPVALLAWLASLRPEKAAQAITISRQYPAILPGQFKSYLARADMILAFAESHALKTLASGVKAWQKRSRSFHHGSLRKCMRRLAEAGLYNASLDNCPAVFDAWLELAPKEQLTVAGTGPEIAVVMPVYNPDLRFLREAIGSVLEQSYQNWQLCIADDCSTCPEVRAELLKYSQTDSRIRLALSEHNGGIAKATNSALALADCAWIAFMDQDDLLAPGALASVAAAIQTDPDLSFIYSDEDHIDCVNIRRSPVFKPGLSFWPCFIPGHLTACKIDLIRKTGDLRSACDGSQDYDLFLRMLPFLHSGQIRHIPEILYHWRIHPGSTAGSSQTKPYVFRAAQKALEDYCQTGGMNCQAIRTGFGTFCNPLYEWPKGLKGAIVRYGSAGNELLEPPQANGEIAVLHCHAQSGAVAFTDRPEQGEPASLSWPMLRDAMLASRADVFLFLAGGLMPLAECRLDQLLIAASLPGIGAAGAMIWLGERLLNGGLYPDMDGRLFPLLQGATIMETARFCWGELGRIHAVASLYPGCIAISRANLQTMQPLDADVPQDFATALCLQLAKNGKLAVVSPFANLILEGEVAKPGKSDPIWSRALCQNPIRNANLRAAPDNGWTPVLAGQGF